MKQDIVPGFAINFKIYIMEKPYEDWPIHPIPVFILILFVIVLMLLEYFRIVNIGPTIFDNFDYFCK
jgi:hypothetical protein